MLVTSLNLAAWEAVRHISCPYGKHLYPGHKLSHLIRLQGSQQPSRRLTLMAGSFEAVDLWTPPLCLRHELNNLTFIEGNFMTPFPGIEGNKKGMLGAYRLWPCQFSGICLRTNQTLSEWGVHIVFDDPGAYLHWGVWGDWGNAYPRDGLHAEQIFPHLVFRAYWKT